MKLRMLRDMRMDEDFGDMTERGVKEVEIYKENLRGGRRRGRGRGGRQEGQRQGRDRLKTIFSFFILCSSMS